MLHKGRSPALVPGPGRQWSGPPCFWQGDVVDFLGMSIHRCLSLPPLDEVPQVTVQPASTVQKLGGTVILGCVVEPPWMNITWRLNGKELNDSDDALGILLTGGTLVITALSNHTVGRYQCVARMPAGAVASVPATVTLASESLLLPLQLSLLSSR